MNPVEALFVPNLESKEVVSAMAICNLFIPDDYQKLSESEQHLRQAMGQEWEQLMEQAREQEWEKEWEHKFIVYAENSYKVVIGPTPVNYHHRKIAEAFKGNHYHVAGGGYLRVISQKVKGLGYWRNHFLFYGESGDFNVFPPEIINKNAENMFYGTGWKEHTAGRLSADPIGNITFHWSSHPLSSPFRTR